MRGEKRGHTRVAVAVAAGLRGFDGRELDKPGFRFFFFSFLWSSASWSVAFFVLSKTLSLLLINQQQQSFAPLRLRDRQHGDAPRVREQKEEVARGALFSVFVFVLGKGGRG